MSNYTPGPWEASEQKGKPGHCVMAQVFAFDGKALALVEPRDNEEEASAAARLLAAAPDLLEACKALRALVGTTEENWQSLYAAARKAADAAIAKAEGEA